MNSAGQIGGFVSSVVFGRIVGRTGRYDLAVLLVAAMTLISGLLFARMGADGKEETASARA